jgi:hypothetical protein
VKVDQSGAHGIQVNVIHEGFQIVSAGGFDQDGFVAPAENVPPFLVAGIKTARVGVLKPLHPVDQVGLRCLKHPVVVVGH